MRQDVESEIEGERETMMMMEIKEEEQALPNVPRIGIIILWLL